ncbi:hypothetical protein Halha_2444 [Halobacteroides halobius DSM 5150]|uniref:Translocation and assembly module TamB C-terminal domain-containing protein n=1 Tax=Halobacteroides halobius (strain ATCC 35273 / DSM 5150 / MD-1) TaxID=748449 RepID=L0KE32_HALHC|nr:translocation/assembly module TamB domain-containing protein [Halobacteroides halobius]AGB42318.1 hypothetical protein Halha_2444 [Halobacteroides halobius DSM 5150]
MVEEALQSKKSLLIVGILLFILVATFYLNDNLLLQIKEPVISQLEKRIKTELQIGEVSLGGFNQIIINDVRIKGDISNLLQVKQVIISYNLGDLIFGALNPVKSIEEISFIEPQLRLIKRKKWNYQSLKKSILKSSPNQTKSKTSNLSLSLQIKDGRIEYDTSKLTTEFKQLTGQIDIEENITVNLGAKVATLKERINLKGVIKGEEYQGKLDFSDIDLVRVAKLIDFNSKVEYQGLLAGEIKFKGHWGSLPNYYGDLALTKASLYYKNNRLKDISGYFSINNYGLKVKRLFARYKKSPLVVKGEVFSWQKPQLNLKYKFPQLQLAKLNNFLPPNLNLAGLANITGHVRGGLKQPNLVSEIKLSTGKINQIPINDFASKLYYKDGILNLKKLNFKYGSGQFTSNGMLSIKDDFNYILSAEFKKIDLSRLKSIIPGNYSLSGFTSGEGIISGKGFKKQGVNFLGSLSVEQGSIAEYEFDQFQSDFWLSQGKMFLNQAQLIADKSTFDLSGTIDLAGNIKLNLDANKIKLEELKSIHHLNELAGIISLDGKLEGNLYNPSFVGDFKINDLVYKDLIQDNLNLEKVNGRLTFKEQELTLTQVQVPKLNSQLSGKFNFSNLKSKLLIQAAKVKADKLLSALGLDLPIQGLVTGRTRINNLLDKPVIKGRLSVSNGKAYGQQFTKAQLNYSYKEGAFIINDLQARYNNSFAQAKGSLKDNYLNLKFISDKLRLQDINPLVKLAKVAGQANVEGSLYGDLDNLKVAGKVSSHQLKVKGYKLGEVSARLYYSQSELDVTNGKLNDQDNQYQFAGSIDLYKQSFDQFVVDIIKGDLTYLNQLLPVKIKGDYQLTGRIKANGFLKEPKLSLDLSALDSDKEGSLKLQGDYWFKNGVDLFLAAHNFNLNFLNQLEEVPYKVTGELDLTGQISGQLDNLNLDSNLQVSKGQIADLNYQQLAGRLRIINGQQLLLKQELQVQGNNVLQAKGLVPLTKDERFDLDLRLEEGNLSLLSLLVDDVDLAQGQGSAQLSVGGTWEHPVLTGEAKLKSGSISHPVLDRKIKGLTGKVLFKKGQAMVKKLTGQYGTGQFQLGGTIALDGVVPANYNLKLTGQDIAFEHGSWQGLNDLQLKIGGSLKKPLIKGNIIAHNMRFRLPFKWPTKSDKKPAVIKPRFDLVIKPGQDVKVGNENIDILVQNGKLNLKTVDGTLQLTGRLKSNTGRFTYYNTVFELQEGTARFNKYSYIPNLDIQAKTMIQGTEIKLDLAGPANHLNFALSSDPALTRREIISLLMGQGGIGNLLQKNYEQAVKNELWRIMGEGLKTELLYKVERSFEQSLDLDKVRIKSLLSNQLKIEIGKFIFDNFMLKYNRTFGMEEKQSLGFEYNFSQGLDNLQLRGSYNNLGNYKLRMEATIPF